MMKILVLNGSPKGDLSVTLQYVRYVQKKHPEHDYQVVHVGQRIKKLEREPAVLEEILADVRTADVVVWATPVYYMLVPGQLKRFVELVAEVGGVDAFAGRYAAGLTTSINFYDHTAHIYLAGISEDWDMRYWGGYSAHMSDLQKEEGRARLLAFAEGLFEAAAAGTPLPRAHAPLVPHNQVYTSGAAAPTVDQGDRRVVIIADDLSGSPNLAQMVERVEAGFARPVDLIDLSRVDIKAGCQGCLQCGADNHCAFEGKDAFNELYRDRVMTADLIFFAGAIRDRYLSAAWKTFFDRSFFRGHCPTLIGKQVSWLVSGPLRQLANLRQIIEAYTQMHGANLVDVVTDEYADPGKIDALLDALVARAVAWAAIAYRRPRDFMAVGGQKLFRDAIWGNLRLTFPADHRVYRKLGMYDFPQREWSTRLSHLLIPLLSIPSVRQQFTMRIKEGMVAPLKQIVESA
jgi:multimeric flavodoxin WrbA